MIQDHPSDVRPGEILSQCPSSGGRRISCVTLDTMDPRLGFGSVAAVGSASRFAGLPIRFCDVPRAEAPSPVLHVPLGSRLRPTASLAQLRLAVGRALLAQMENSSRWTELALVTDTEDAIYETRLLRALRFGDDDYEACIYGVVPALLGHREVDPNDWPTVVGQPVDVYLDKLPLLEEHLDLPNWLAQYQPSLHRALYAHDLAEAASLEGVSAVAAELDLTEIARQLERLHRDLGDDLPAAIGHAKDLVESACKHILGEAGSGAGSRGPALVDAALRSVGRHPGRSIHPTRMPVAEAASGIRGQPASRGVWAPKPRRNRAWAKWRGQA